MIGDVLLIDHKHERVAQELAGRLNKLQFDRIAVAIGGESGSGKSEIAETLRNVLRTQEYKVKILHLDNYYNTAPKDRNEIRQKKGVQNSVGLQEIHWDILKENIDSFRGGKPTTIPFLDLFTDQEDKLITDFKDIDVLIIEGLYACNAPADLRVFIDVTYHETKKAQLKRGKEKVDEFRMAVLEQEHRAVQGLRDQSDFFVTPDFNLVDNTEKNSPAEPAVSTLRIYSQFLPLSLSRKRSAWQVVSSIDGVSTAISSVYRSYNSTWYGDFPGGSARLTESGRRSISRRLNEEYNCQPLFVDGGLKGSHHLDFCRRTIWPMFHYFPERSEFHSTWWESYQEYNLRYFKKISRTIKPDDTLWIHSHPLMLLPSLIRDKFPDVSIGYFLHTPFPSYEIFRLIPWRREILQGILGADLIGFHTYGYARHFLSSVYRLLGHESAMGSISLDNRLIRVDAFPLGIDYERFATAAKDVNIQEDMQKLVRKTGDCRIILSVDRLDYTRGILDKVRIIDIFLKKYRQYIGKVVFRINLTVPDKSWPSHEEYKKQVEAEVRDVNRRYKDGSWKPIHYTLGALSQHEIMTLYNVSDILMVNSLRDGLNLITKEYLASRSDNKGVLITSELIGGARELSESLTVNPNNYDGVVDALHTALKMPAKEQVRRNKIMRARLERNTAVRWAVEFLDELRETRQKQNELSARLLTAAARTQLCTDFYTAENRLLVIDYNGTLVPASNTQDKATMSAQTRKLVQAMAAEKANTIVIVSDSSREYMDNWFHDIPVELIASSDTWHRNVKGKWQNTETIQIEWMDEIRSMLENWADRTPGAYVLEKEYSLEWHFEKADRELGRIRARELSEDLTGFTAQSNLQVNERDWLIEIKNAGLYKGRSLKKFFDLSDWGFILAAGDDWTNEAMYHLLPEKAYSIRIGMESSLARYNLRSQEAFISLLLELANTS